jgi:uncharacterized protein (DUF433 family)
MEPLVIIDRGGTPRLARSRINVYDVVHYLEGGHSANYIALTLGITLAETQALMKYIEEHKEEVMAVHRQIEERIARGNPPEIAARMAESPTHALIEARWAEIQRRRAQEKNGESDPR